MVGAFAGKLEREQLLSRNTPFFDMFCRLLRP